jgi:predicted ATP-binding protein involved in virulence
MSKQILSIKGETPHTHKLFDIDVGGKNLIITGKNGSGKTSFLKKLHETISKQIKEKQDDQQRASIERNIQHWETQLQTNPEGSSKHAQARENFVHQFSQLEAIKQAFDIQYQDRLDFAAKIDKNTAVIDYFEATRQSNISQATNASSVDEEQTKQVVTQSRYNSVSLGGHLEQYLVNLKVRHAFAKNNPEEQQLAKNIESWFHDFDNQLRFLIEEENAILEFDANKMKVWIQQNANQQYNFQQLSSGFSAIFHIYAALLVRIRYLNITPDELTGLVLIDEIDAHLHLSLQRKILPFLTRSFPNVQFIVTTHSPFVITSVQDTIVYDISRGEQVEGDLSLYSYQVVAEGLLGVDPASDILIDKIKLLAKLTKRQEITQELQNLVNELSVVYEELDEESRFFVNRAKLLINRSTTDGAQNV